MFQEKQIEIVQKIASHVSANWDKITLNIEIGKVHGTESNSPNTHVWNGENKEQIRIPMQSLIKFHELRNLMRDKDPEGRAWNICDLVIERSGSYKMDFSYEPPVRLATMGWKQDDAGER